MIPKVILNDAGSNQRVPEKLEFVFSHAMINQSNTHVCLEVALDFLVFE